jgi:hypothetical protein
MLGRLVYLGLRRLAELVPLVLRRDVSKEVEILVLRHLWGAKVGAAL